jgi:hypothetical protein
LVLAWDGWKGFSFEGFFARAPAFRVAGLLGMTPSGAESNALEEVAVSASAGAWFVGVDVLAPARASSAGVEAAVVSVWPSLAGSWLMIPSAGSLLANEDDDGADPGFVGMST